MYFEEFHVGQHFDVKPVTFSAEEIDEFAQQYDPQPIHIDPEFAQNGLFRGIIASGFHTLSAVWAQWIRSNRFGAEIIGGAGLDFVQWTAPVRPGDTLFTDVEVAETVLSSSGTRGLVALAFHVTNQEHQAVLETQGGIHLKCRPTPPGTAKDK